MRPYRTVATTIAIAIIAATLFSSLYLTNGAVQSLDAGLTRMGADLMVVPTEYSAAGQNVLITGEPTTFFFKSSGFEQISQIPGVSKASPEIYLATLYGQSCCSAPVQLIAIDPERDFTISQWLRENPGIAMKKDDIIVGSMIEGPIGSNLKFYGLNFTIAGRLTQTGMGIDSSVFTRVEDAYVMAEESPKKAVQNLTIPKGMMSAVLVKVQPGTKPSIVAEEITKRIPGTKVITPNGLLAAVSGQLSAITRLLLGATLAVTIVSIPLLGFISAMVANERRREISLLRVLGAPRAYVIKLMLAESFSLSIIGGFIGVGMAMLFLVAFQDLIATALKIPFITPSFSAILSDSAIAIILSIVIGGIASIWPAVVISRTEPYECIRGGES